jgi:quercetin dioxygenase-like cupin family protein
MKRQIDTVPQLPKPFIDARGKIQLVCTDLGGSVDDAHYLQHRPIGSVSVITSKAGTERASHRHLQDCHMCYLVSGSMEYFERDEKGEIVRTVILAGQAFFTPEGVEHTMRFLEDSTFVVIADRERDQSDYEEDLFRVASLAKEWDTLQAAQK